MPQWIHTIKLWGEILFRTLIFFLDLYLVVLILVIVGIICLLLTKWPDIVVLFPLQPSPKEGCIALWWLWITWHLFICSCCLSSIAYFWFGSLFVFLHVLFKDWEGNNANHEKNGLTKEFISQVNPLHYVNILSVHTLKNAKKTSKQDRTNIVLKHLFFLHVTGFQSWDR